MKEPFEPIYLYTQKTEALDEIDIIEREKVKILQNIYSLIETYTSLNNLQLRLLDKEPVEEYYSAKVYYNSFNKAIRFEVEALLSILKPTLLLGSKNINTQRMVRSFWINTITELTTRLREAGFNSDFKDKCFIIIESNFIDHKARDTDNLVEKYILDAIRNNNLIKDDTWKNITRIHSGSLAEDLTPKTKITLVPMGIPLVINSEGRVELSEKDFFEVYKIEGTTIEESYPDELLSKKSRNMLIAEQRKETRSLLRQKGIKNINQDIFGLPR